MCRQLTRKSLPKSFESSSLTSDKLHIPNSIYHTCQCHLKKKLQVFQKCTTLCLRPFKPSLLIRKSLLVEDEASRVSKTCWHNTPALRQSDRITLGLRNWTDNTWLSHQHTPFRLIIARLYAMICAVLLISCVIWLDGFISAFQYTGLLFSWSLTAWHRQRQDLDRMRLCKM